MKVRKLIEQLKRLDRDSNIWRLFNESILKED